MNPLPFRVRLVGAATFNADRCPSCDRKLVRRVDATGRALYWETDHEIHCIVRALGLGLGRATTSAKNDE